MALSIQPLSFVIDPIADHHTDAGSVLRVGCCPDFILGDGCRPIWPVPKIMARMAVVCPQTDGDPLEGRFVGILNPVLDTGPLSSGLQDCQKTTKQSRINYLIIVIIIIIIIISLPALHSVVAPFNVLRHHKVLVTLHRRLATLVSEGVLVVADINPGSRLSPVGQSGGSR